MRSIEEFFSLLWKTPDSIERIIPLISLEEGAFPAYLEVDISEDEFEVPTFLLPYVLPAKRDGYTKLVFNLVNGTDGLNRRTAHRKTITTILKQFDYASTSTMRIAHVITSKGLHYYGCRGAIFNESYEPLLLATVKVKFDSNRDSISLSNPKCRLSYKVFDGASEIVEKTIIKQAIPFYASHSVDIQYDRNFYGRTPVELAIEHMGSMIIKPMTPTPSLVTMASFNGTISAYYETQ